MPSDCPYGEPEQGTLGRYPCLGGCGCWTVVPTACLRCYLAARTYSPSEVRMLSDDDPRRNRTRGGRPGDHPYPRVTSPP